MHSSPCRTVFSAFSKCHFRATCHTRALSSGESRLVIERLIGSCQLAMQPMKGIERVAFEAIVIDGQPFLIAHHGAALLETAQSFSTNCCL